MGDFVHRFLQRLSTGPKEKFGDWEKLFDELWESDGNAEVRDINGINIYMLNAKFYCRGYTAMRKIAAKVWFLQTTPCVVRRNSRG